MTRSGNYFWSQMRCIAEL